MEVKPYDANGEIDKITITPLTHFAKGLMKKTQEALDAPYKVLIFAGRWEQKSKTVLLAKYLSPDGTYPRLELELDNTYEDGPEALETIIAWAKIQESPFVDGAEVQ